MPTIKVPLFVNMSSLTQTEEDALALTLVGMPVNSSTIWNSTLKKIRCWNGTDFETTSNIPESILPDNASQYKEFIYTGEALTRVNTWEDDTMTTKLYQTDFTYTSEVLSEALVTRIIDNFAYNKTFIYDGNGVLINVEITII